MSLTVQVSRMAYLSLNLSRMYCPDVLTVPTNAQKPARFGHVLLDLIRCRFGS